MTLDRIRTAAALLLLALLAYTRDGQWQRISSYPLESGTREPVRNSLVVLAYSWPVLFFAYRRRHAPAAIPRWSLWLAPVFAVLSGFFILSNALLGRPAIGAYLALTADAVLRRGVPPHSRAQREHTASHSFGSQPDGW